MPAAGPEEILRRFPERELETLVEIRRDLHRHPELGFEETRTSGIVASRLEALGLPARRGVGRTGVISDFPGCAPRILLRADMDGLPLDEQGSSDYVSQTPGRMHACGHDGHVSIALALARRLAARTGDGASAPWRLLFQPAEEGAGGAVACARDGALDGVGSAFGLHLWNQLPVGQIGVNRGALMAAVDEFTIEVDGPGGHGASPHETADPIVGAARIVEALQTIVSREISPLDAAVVSIGTIQAGSAFNVIPSRVTMTGTARSFTESAGRAIPEKMERIVRGTAEAAGVAATLRYRRVNKATVNDPAMADLVIEAASRILGAENVETETRTLGGEDMSVFLDQVPGCFFFVGSAPAGEHRPHHSPRFDFDERALAIGLEVFEAVALEAGRR